MINSHDVNVRKIELLLSCPTMNKAHQRRAVTATRHCDNHMIERSKVTEPAFQRLCAGQVGNGLDHSASQTAALLAGPALDVRRGTRELGRQFPQR